MARASRARSALGTSAIVSAVVGIVAGCSERTRDTAVDSGSARVASDPACGDLPCETFPTAEAAFSRVLADAPSVLAVGESHAWTGDTGKSPTKRFVESFLPLLDCDAGGASFDAGGACTRARALVVELWVADGTCKAQAPREVAAVASAQREVAKRQAPKNQSDFLALYEGARRHGLRAKLLVPPCETYAKILNAGPRDIDTMLTMIADVTARDVEALLTEGDATGGPRDGIVIAYGGAMHNDLVPRPGHARWSFGPRLAKATAGRYVELDLVIPENVHDSEATRAQPWYPHFAPSAQGNRAILFRVRVGSYALVFPPAPRDAHD